MDHAVVFMNQYNDPHSAFYYLHVLEEVYPRDPLVLFNIGSCPMTAMMLSPQN